MINRWSLQCCILWSYLQLVLLFHSQFFKHFSFFSFFIIKLNRVPNTRCSNIPPMKANILRTNFDHLLYQPQDLWKESPNCTRPFSNTIFSILFLHCTNFTFLYKSFRVLKILRNKFYIKLKLISLEFFFYQLWV